MCLVYRAQLFITEHDGKESIKEPSTITLSLHAAGIQELQLFLDTDCKYLHFREEFRAVFNRAKDPEIKKLMNHPTVIVIIIINHATLFVLWTQRACVDVLLIKKSGLIEISVLKVTRLVHLHDPLHHFSGKDQDFKSAILCTN